MQLRLLSLALAAAALAAAQTPAPAPGAATAGTNVTGTILNATTNQPLAHSPVSLLLLQGGMKPIASSTTDAAGHYRFSETTPGPFLVEADYQGVPYFAKVANGQAETNVQVYNASHDPKQLRVDAEIMVLQPDAGQLAIVNEYRVENALSPPQTLTRPGGMFRFRVPPGARVDMVRVVGPGEMPLALAAGKTSQHDIYSADSPLRPGETRFQVSYRVPYAGLKAALAETPVFAPSHFEVYVPGPMTFAGANFTQVGSQDGYTVYGTAEPVAATLNFNVSGDAPMPAAPASDASAPGAAPAPDGASAAPAPDAAAVPADATTGIVPAPTFLERNRWTMLALLVLAAAAGLGILLARPEAAAGAAPAPPAGPLPPPPAAPTSELALLLAQLKDDLFLLEVRRHTGDISEAEYERLRAALNARLDQLAGRVPSGAI